MNAAALIMPLWHFLREGESRGMVVAMKYLANRTLIAKALEPSVLFDSSATRNDEFNDAERPRVGMFRT